VTQRNDGALGWSGRWIAWLIRIFPGDFRRNYGDDMLSAFLDQRDEAARSARVPLAATLLVATVTLRLSWQLLKAGVAERRSMTRNRLPPRSAGKAPMMDTMISDLRYAVRGHLKRPAFAVIAVLTLALGIGANTAIFSVVNGVLLRPLPYNDPAELIDVQVNSGIAGGPEWYGTSEPEYMDLSTQITSFAHVAASTGSEVTLGDSAGAGVRRVRIARVTANLFPLLGVPPLLGRTFGPDEDQPNGSRAIVLSYGMWQRDFGGDPDIIGRTVSILDRAVPIVGVMPAGFEFPDPTREAWAPLGLDWEDPWDRNNHYLRVMARLAPGATVDAAQSEVSVLAARSTADYPRFYPDPGYRIRLRPYHTRIVGDARTPLYVLLGAVGFVLLAACVNVANLLLARGEARKRELAIRTAVGASGRRVARQLLTENFLLALAGGVAGLAVAFLGVRTLLAIGPDSVPRLNQITIDGSVLGFSFAIAVGTGLVFGIMPALQAARSDVQEVLKEGGGDRGSTRAGHAVRRTLVATQVMLAVLLVTGAGLMLRSVLNIYRVDTGFRTENVLTFRLSPSSNKYDTQELRVTFYRDLLEQLNSLPGVATAGAVSSLPLVGGTNNWSIIIEGQPAPTVADAPAERVQRATPEYFDALGFTLLRGRLFTHDDNASTTGVVVINESMARAHWPGQDPLGKRMKVFAGSRPWMEVIGVVRDVRYNAVNRPPGPRWYVPHAQAFVTAYSSPLSMTVVLHTDNDPRTLLGSVRNLMATFDSSVPTSRVQTMEEVFAGAVEGERFVTILLSVFGIVALFLAAVGVYGVISYAVSQRTHEIGLRMALGARGSSVLFQVVREGLVLALIGVGVGLLGSVALSRGLESMVFGITPTDPLTYIGVIVVLTAAAAGASLIPARRASRVNPMVALRLEN
jgi:putative ABC transport system permease protein